MSKRAAERRIRQERLIKAVREWQSAGKARRLTCGYDKKHRPLKAVKRGDDVLLVCPDCDYEQSEIPEVVTQSALPPPVIETIPLKKVLLAVAKAKPPVKATRKAR